MSKHTCSLTLLKGVFPEAAAAWVIPSLRHEPFVWQSLLDIEFASRAIEFLGNEPKNWSPASLALLSLGLPTRTENYHSTSLSSLDKDLRKQVSKHFEELTQGKNLYEVVPDDGDLHPQWFSQHALSQVGLIALAMRERLHLVGSWEGFQEDLEGLPNFSVYTWFAPLTILYGLIPDPHALLLELTNPASSYEMNSLAVHILLSNPAPEIERWNSIKNILANASSNTQANVINFLILKHPQLGKETARWLAEQPVKYPLDLLDNPNMDLLSQLAVLTHQAELFRNAGLLGQSMRLLDSAMKVSANLQEDYSTRWYAIAEQASIDPENDHILDTLNSIPGGKLVNHFSDTEISDLDLSPTELAQVKMQIRSGDQDIINPFLSIYIGDGAKEKEIRIPYDVKLVLAQYLLNSGDLKNAEIISIEIHEALEQEDSEENIEQWLVNLYGADSQTKLDFLESLIEIQFHLGRKKEVVGNSLRILRKQPNHLHFLNLLGKIYYQTGQLEEALHVFELITLIEPLNLLTRREYARCLEINLDFEGAFTEWSLILEESLDKVAIDTPPILDMLGVASSAILAGRPELAIDLCQKILTSDVSNWQAHILLGKAYTAIEQIDEGLASLQIAIQLAPDQPEPWLETAKIYTALGQSQQAMHILQTAIQAVPDSSEIQLELGAAYLNENALTSAVVHLRKSYEQTNPNQPDFSNPDKYILFIHASEYLGETLRRLGQIHESCQVLESAVSSVPGHFSPKHKSLLYEYAQSLLALGEIAEAVPLLERVISFEPESLQPYLEYGRALLTLGIKANAAVDALSYVYKADPQNAEALALLADALAADHQHTEAMDAYLEVMETDITQEIEWQERLNLGLGRTALALEQVETAIAALQEAANINPRNPVIYHWLADACWTADLSLDAWIAAKKTIQLDGKNSENLAWFADHTISLVEKKKLKRISLLESKNFDEQSHDLVSSNLDADDILAYALQAFQQAYSIISDSPEMLVRMGHLQAAAGKTSSAVETLRIAIDHENPTIDVLHQAALILLNLNDFKNTIRSLEKGLSYTIDDPQIRVTLQKDLIRAFLASNDQSSAENYLDSAIQFSPNDISLYQTLSLIQISDNRLDQALKTLSTAADKCPNDEQHLAEINYLIAWSLKGKGVFASALNHACTSLQLIQKQQNNRTNNLDQFDVISLAAQLARSILEPEKVRGYLSSLPQVLDFGILKPCNIANLHECYTAAAELALEIGDGAWAIAALGNITKAISHDPNRIHADHVRTLALQAQINLLQGNENAAQENYETCLHAFELLTNQPKDNHHTQNIHPTWERPISQNLSPDYTKITYWDFLGVINTSITLYQFEDALRLSEQVASQWASIPLTSLTHARVLTLRTEHQNVCKDIEVYKNFPRIEKISPDPAHAFLTSIQAAEKSLINVTDNSRNQPEDNPLLTQKNLNFLRWHCRGKAVFFANPLSWEAEEWSNFPMSSDDTASRLASARRWIEINPNPTSHRDLVQREVRLAESFKFNFEVMCQLILLLEHENPEEAFLLAHNYENQPNAFKDRMQQAIFYALLAQVSYRFGEVESAYQALRTALNIWPGEPYWNLLAVKVLMENPEILAEELNPAIVSHLEEAIQQEPRMPEIYELIWKLFDSDNSTQTVLNQEGIVLLENAASEYPDQPNIILTLARAYFISGKIADQKQVTYYSKQVISLKNSSDNQVNEATLLLAEMELQKKDAQEAFKLAGNVRTIDSENTHAIMVQIQALELLGQYTQALAELDNIPELVKNTKKLALKQAQLLGKSESKEVELSALEDLAKKYPNDLDVLWALAQCLTDTGQIDRAVQAAQNALLSTPPNGERKYLSGLHLLLGNLLSRLGQLDQAIHHLSKSVDYQPDYVDPYLILGEVYQKQRLHVKARKAYQQAIRVAPLDPRPYIQAAVSLKEGKDYQNAETMLRRAVELSPHDVGIRKQLAAVVAINLVNNPSPVQSHSIQR